jgi:hypothetical protein
MYDSQFRTFDPDPQQYLKEISRCCESILVRKSDLPVLGADNPDATRSSLVNRLRNWEDHGGWQDFSTATGSSFTPWRSRPA